MEGECAQVPVAPWSSTLRAVGRFDDVRGPTGTYCRFTLGYNGRSSWVIAVGDQATASAPIARGASVALDPHAINTSVAFMHDLMEFSFGHRDEPPPNVLPAVLHALGADQPGSAAQIATLRLFEHRGGVSGAAISAVIAARAIDGQQIEVAFAPVVVTVSQEHGAWVVTHVRASNFAVDSTRANVSPF